MGLRAWSLAVVVVVAAGCDGEPSSSNDLAVVAHDDLSATADLAGRDLAAPGPGPDLAAPSDLSATAGDGGAVDAGHARRFVSKPLGLGNTIGRVQAIAGAGGTVYFGGEYGVASTSSQGASFSVDNGLTFVRGVTARASTVVAATDSGLFASTTGGAEYDRVSGGDAGLVAFRGVSGSGNDLFAVGPAGTIWSSANGGTSFAPLAPPPSLSANDQSVWVDASTVLIAGEKSLRSTDRGAHWQAMPLSTNATAALWGTGAGDVWAVGGYYFGGTPTYFGEIHHSTDRGATWTKQVGYYTTGEPELLLIDGALFGVWGSSASDVWVVGAGGTILRSSDQGASWDRIAIATTSTLRAVWGTSPTDVWVAGDNGIWHYE